MIWSYPEIDKLIDKKVQVTHGEGNTPIEEVLLKPEGSKPILIKLKREDVNPNGSFKDRSLAFQISYYKQKGIKELVISSTGNAAVSAIAYCKDANIDLHVFISEDISESKMRRIKLAKSSGVISLRSLLGRNIKIYKSKKPKSDAIKFAKKNNLINLRGSFDDIALIGFKTLGYEIGEISDIVDSIYIPCSSGTSTVGIYQGLKEMEKKKKIRMPKINIVQTTKVHPIAAFFDKKFENEDTNPADSIADRVANRLKGVVEAVEKTNGFGWVISKQELEEALSLLKEKDFSTISHTAALSVAGIIKASRNNKLSENPLAIISGL